MKILSIVVVSLLLTVSGWCQNNKRAYKNLEKQDYEKAHEFFNEILAESPDNVAAHFGLAVVYSTENTALKDYLKAWKHADYTEKNLNKLSSEDQEIISEYFINTEERRSSRPVNKKMQLAIEHMLDKLIRLVREGNDLEIVYKVLEEFPDFRYAENVIHIRNYLEFRKVEKQNTIEAYNGFISEFPDAAQVPQAIEQRNKLAFIQVKKENTVAALNTFIDQYSDSRFLHEAIRIRNNLAFQMAKQLNTIEAFEKFINDYPDAIELLTAKKIQMRLIYERAKEVNTLEAYNEFINKFPEGRQYIDIFNLKSTHLGNKFKVANKYPIFDLNWIRVFDNNSIYDILAETDVDSEGNIIVAGTTQDKTGNIDAWCLKLNEKGEMLWNKKVGEYKTDILTNVAVNSENELFFAGVTNKTHIDSSDGEAWLFKLNEDGIKLWNRSFNDFSLNDVKVDPEGHLVVGGYVDADSTGMFHYQVIKLNQSGKRLWTRKYSNFGRVNELSVSENGNILVGGDKWVFLLDKEGYIRWEYYPDNNDSITAVQIIPEGYILSGTRNNRKFYISMLDNQGKEKWLKAYDSEFPSVISQVKQDESGNISAIGYSGRDGIYIRLKPNGDMISTNLIGSAGIEMLTSISLLESKSYIVGCSTFDERNQNNDIVLLKYNPGK